jgi:hypothetical protein
VLVEKTIVTKNISTVTFARLNLSNLIFSRKNGANIAQIGRICSNWLNILNSLFQLKKLLLREKIE